MKSDRSGVTPIPPAIASIRSHGPGADARRQLDLFILQRARSLGFDVERVARALDVNVRLIDEQYQPDSARRSLGGRRTRSAPRSGLDPQGASLPPVDSSG